MVRIVRVMLAVGLALTLAGCDKCGEPLKFTLFETAPKSCTSDGPQG